MTTSCSKENSIDENSASYLNGSHLIWKQIYLMTIWLGIASKIKLESKISFVTWTQESINNYLKYHNNVLITIQHRNNPAGFFKINCLKILSYELRVIPAEKCQLEGLKSKQNIVSRFPHPVLEIEC